MCARSPWLPVFAAVCSIFPVTTQAGNSGDQPDFTRDVKPLLSDACYHCHGPDANTREAGLRFDTREGAFAMLKSGATAIVPGDVAASALVKRITSTDPDEIMPPLDAHLALTEQQKDALTQWIASGAQWSEHWSMVPPQKKAPPSAEASPIDHFIQQRLQQNGFAPSPLASRATLIRRLSLDLRGLPPGADEVDAFVNDSSADAWERLVDRYLASVHTAERLAMDWLDAARYADTNGYSIDDHRDMWAWRDWVIGAFDRNVGYDKFLTEQIAGDLIPDATPQQVMATGFLRNSMNTHEGGTIPEEYRVAYVADKVDTVATVFMGLTMKCAQCHDHKYDPIAMRDYYRFFAFFNTTDEPGQGPTSGGNAAPFIEVESPFVGKEALQARARARQEWLRAAHSEGTKSFEKELSYFDELEKTGSTTVMVMNLKPRETFMLERGEYSKPGERVTAGTPGSLPPLEIPTGTEATRLDLARWLTQPAHPLTARVAVNRYWQFLFGTGLVKTAEDFGSQGELPSHPELLDWLAVRFVESNWNVKSLLKDIVMTDTYRQTTAISAELLEADPENRLLGRSPRHRLPAEIVRDNALAIAGLLVPDVGGPGVYPYQPEGLWKEVSHYGPHAFTAMAYWQGSGSDHYRRSLYTFWKRTSPPPSLMAFDAPSRETCTIRRQNTNTPIQALVLMNDPQFVEASRALAARMLSEVKGDDARARIDYGFQLATARRPTTTERDILHQALTRNLLRFHSDPDAAKALLTIGELPAGPLDPVDHAAYTMAASIILNLDETITEP